MMRIAIPEIKPGSLCDPDSGREMELKLKVVGIERQQYRDGMALVTMRDVKNGPKAVSLRLELPDEFTETFQYNAVKVIRISTDLSEEGL